MHQPLTSGQPHLAAIVLAAGDSSRLGYPKQLLRYRGKRLLARAAQMANHAVNGDVIVVLGANQLRFRNLLRRELPRIRVAYNAAWREGMSGSLATGIAALPKSAAAALILLVDQPFLQPADLENLISAWRRRPGLPAAAAADGRVGVPAILPRRHLIAIRSLQGDTGARQLLRAGDDISRVSLPAASVDIDTPEDAAALKL